MLWSSSDKAVWFGIRSLFSFFTDGGFHGVGRMDLILITQAGSFGDALGRKEVSGWGMITMIFLLRYPFLSLARYTHIYTYRYRCQSPQYLHKRKLQSISYITLRDFSPISYFPIYIHYSLV